MAEDRWETKQEEALNSQMDRESQSVSRDFCHLFYLLTHQTLPTLPYLSRLCILTLNPTVLYPIRTLGAGGTDSSESPDIGTGITLAPREEQQ